MKRELETVKAAFSDLQKIESIQRLDLIARTKRNVDAEVVMEKLKRNAAASSASADDAMQKVTTASLRSVALAKVAMDTSTVYLADMAAKAAWDMAVSAFAVSAMFAESANAAVILASHETGDTGSKAARESAQAMKQRAEFAHDQAVSTVKMTEDLMTQVRSMMQKQKKLHTRRNAPSTEPGL